MFLKNLKHKQNYFDLAICLLITCLIFSLSLFRSWIFYDEYAVYNETFIPIPSSFNELVEILSSFGLINNFGSSNFLYSAVSVIRTNLLGVPLLLVLGLFFKKTAFFYHVLCLLLHLINTALVFFILKTIFNNQIRRIILIGLVLLWSIHPVQIESVLLSSNIGATISYIFFFALFYDFIKNKDKNNLAIRKILLPILFLLPMLLNEYVIALPLILVFYSFIENYKNNSLKLALKKTFSDSFPYITGLLLYVIYFLLSYYAFFQPVKSHIGLTLERMFWLTPQIIVHYLKLVLFPKTLSIDQTAHVHLGHSILDLYSIFCILFVFIFLFIPLIIFLLKRKLYIFTLTAWLFFISLMPFSQFLSFTYCLAAERYLYTPLFILIFGFGLFLCNNNNSLKNFKKIFLVLFVIVLSLCGIRSVTRVSNWQNNGTLLEVTIKSSSDDLYKGYNIGQLALTQYRNDKEKSENLFSKVNKLLYKAIEKYSNEKVHKNEPMILKAYGLDPISKTIKAIYLICMHNFTSDKKDTEHCLKLFNPYLKYLDTFDPSTLELYANLLIDKGDLKAGKDIFLYAYKKYPLTPFLLVSLIRFERDIENNLRNTEEYLLKARRLFPYSKDILFEAVRYYQKAGNLKEYARHSYLYGLRAHSKFTYLEALTAYLTLGDLKNTKKSLEKLLKIDPKDPKILYFSGSYHIKMNNYEKAISELEKAYSLRNHDKDLAFKICNTLAALYTAQNDSNKSSFYTKEALKYAGGN